jgi:CheY-like chemotaxis protein
MGAGLGKRRFVLLADDDETICKLIRDMIPDAMVSEVRNGKEVYALLTYCRDLYDLAIIDIHMPEWHGDEAVEMARALGVDTPILFITGDVMKRGLADTLTKPFCIFELQSKIEELLNGGNRLLTGGERTDS